MSGHRPSWRLWSGIAVVLVSLNFRPAVVSMAPLLDEISAAVGLTPLTAGLLLTLPVLCFGALGPTAPIIARRFGIEWTLVGVLLAVVAGSAVRLIPTVPALFLGTLMIGAGIAIGNILLPGLIKRDFPHSIGLMSGLYTLALTGGAALGAGATVPIARAAGLDWNFALGVWGLFAVVGLIVWLPGLRGVRARRGTVTRTVLKLGSDPVAWLVTAYFGFQSLNFYATSAWLPTLLIFDGADPAYAGLMLSLMNLVSIIPAMVSPLIAARMRRQSSFAVALVGFYAVGIVGLMLSPGIAVLWVLVLGIGQGATLGLALAYIVLRSPDSDHATKLSGMSQSWGYLMAAGGPMLLGALFGATGGWLAPLLLLALLLIPQAYTGYRAGLPRLVGAVPTVEPTEEQT
ncbi:MAG: MFS transporter [Terrimesophilobacter sp.]